MCECVCVFFSICSFKNKPTATTKIHLLGTEWKLRAAGLGERSWRKLQKLGELIVQTGCATQPWGVSATFPEARSLCSEGKSLLFCDPPPVFCAFTTRIQRCQRVRFSSGKQAWEPPSPRVPCGSARTGASCAIPYLGGKSTGGNPRASDRHRVPQEQRPP